ncbi:YibE/F family protein, partial [Candidatus Gottesmanbacteria bacterium]|nr:YibE/F family protein [Candidatus Gottesmanbacteria bacterium]
MKRIFINLFLLLMLLFCPPIAIHAQTEITGTQPKEEILEGTITKILEEKEVAVMDKKQIYQKLEVIVTKGSLQDKTITVENGTMPMANVLRFAINDKVQVTYAKDYRGKDLFYISDYVRRGSLAWLLLIFVILTITVARWRGLMSIIGMGISFFVIFSFILPRISTGADPVGVTILGSLFIIPINFFLSHGFNKKTGVAVVGTVIALIVIGVLSSIFVETVKLTGFASEEASFLQILKQGSINMKGILLASIIIGALGVLDDITISQSAIVFQLKEASQKISFHELYSRAMNIGQDHISSMVNTLILVYAGAA